MKRIRTKTWELPVWHEALVATTCRFDTCDLFCVTSGTKKPSMWRLSLSRVDRASWISMGLVPKRSVASASNSPNMGKRSPQILVTAAQLCWNCRMWSTAPIRTWWWWPLVLQDFPNIFHWAKWLARQIWSYEIKSSRLPKNCTWCSETVLNLSFAQLNPEHSWANRWSLIRF